MKCPFPFRNGCLRMEENDLKMICGREFYQKPKKKSGFQKKGNKIE